MNIFFLTLHGFVLTDTCPIHIAPHVECMLRVYLNRTVPRLTSEYVRSGGRCSWLLLV